MRVLDLVADRQAVWSVTANQLKASVDRARTWSFGLSISGASLAAIATQTDKLSLASIARWSAHTGLALASALCLTVSAAIVQQFLSKDAILRPVRARAAAEALKREAYLFATESGPYGQGAASEDALAEKKSTIEQDVQDLVEFQVRPLDKGSCPRTTLSFADYVDQRVDGQIAFYRKRADEYAPIAMRLHRAEWMFALAGAAVSAVASAIGNDKFDFAALTGLATTLGGAVLSHRQANRYDELISSYRATAMRLEDVREIKRQSLSPRDFVQTIETVLEGETKAWLANRSKPAGP